MSVSILRSEARALPLPDESVDLIVTSPPYWGLRDYRDGSGSLAGQIGNEETPQEYLAALWDCTREWARILKPGGSIFANLGDAYSARADGSAGRTWREDRATVLPPVRNTTAWAPRKSLLLLPERYRIGCVDQLGLIARQVVIWQKPNSMPESVQDRCKHAHEDLVHLVKRPRYYSAVDEIREPHTMRPQRRPNGHKERQCLGVLPAQTHSTSQRDEPGIDGHPLGKLPGSVWKIPSQPLNVPGWLGTDHFAAFPMELPRRCILGWSPPGICVACDEGRIPVTEVATIEDRKGRKQRVVDLALDAAHGPDGRGGERWRQSVRVTGYTCACPDPSAPMRPAVVVDPFGGTGTTALVADVLGRHGVSFDLSRDYCRIARWRTTDPGERARAMQVPKPPPVPDGQGALFDVNGAAS